jgi:hypothetical protein
LAFDLGFRLTRIRGALRAVVFRLVFFRAFRAFDALRGRLAAAFRFGARFLRLVAALRFLAFRGFRFLLKSSALSSGPTGVLSTACSTASWGLRFRGLILPELVIVTR